MDAIACKDLAQGVRPQRKLKQPKRISLMIRYAREEEGAESLWIYYLTASKKIHKYDTFSYDCIVRKRLQGAREND